MNEAEAIAECIVRLLPHVKAGSLRFWGIWFGRPYDNVHAMAGCEASGDLLTVTFDRGEVLRIWSPRGATVTHDLFRIAEAERIRWEWDGYGAAPSSEGAIFWEMWRDQNGNVVARSGGPWPPSTRELAAGHPAVEVV